MPRSVLSRKRRAPEATLEAAEPEPLRPRRARRELRLPRLRLSVPLAVLVVGVAYFLLVALAGINAISLRGLEPTVTLEDLAQWGAGLMLLLLLVLLWDRRRQARRPREAPLEPAGWEPPRRAPDELMVTAEFLQGRRVLEYSRPPKSEHGDAVYAKCVVPVDEQFVLRVEDLVAEARE